MFKSKHNIAHQLHGAKIFRAIANLAPHRGIVGKRGAKLLPIRRRRDVQGAGTVGVKIPAQRTGL